MTSKNDENEKIVVKGLRNDMPIHECEKLIRDLADNLQERYPFADLYLINDNNKEVYLGKQSTKTLKNLNITRFSSLKYDYKCIELKILEYQSKFISLAGAQ